MKSYDASSTIQASPDTIWGILTDAPNYSAWDSGVIRVEGRIAQGETIRVVSSANPGRTFPVKVTEFQPGRRMVWSGGMPLAEEYAGPLLGMIWKSMPDLGPSFNQFVAGLKSRAERGR